MKDKIYHVIEDNEFDKLVKEKLGFNYECIAANEWNNDSSYTSDNVTRKDWESEFDQNELLNLIDSNNDGNIISFHTILSYMVYKEMLPDGNYLIDVCW